MSRVPARWIMPASPRLTPLVDKRGDAGEFERLLQSAGAVDFVISPENCGQPAALPRRSGKRRLKRFLRSCGAGPPASREQGKFAFPVK